MKTIIEKIVVMQHYANGGEIEFKETDKWIQTHVPIWNWSLFDYRIKEAADPYAALKAANTPGSGKQIRLRSVKTWHDAGHDWKFDAPVDQYEIRNKPRKVKMLAWFDGAGLVWRMEYHPVPLTWLRMPNLDLEGGVEECLT